MPVTDVYEVEAYAQSLQTSLIEAAHQQESKFREKAKIAQERSYELGAATIIDVLQSRRSVESSRNKLFGDQSVACGICVKPSVSFCWHGAPAE